MPSTLPAWATRGTAPNANSTSNSASERAMLLGVDRREMLKELKPVFKRETLLEIQTAVRKVHTSTALLDYLQDLLDASRQRHSTGISPRGGLALRHDEIEGVGQRRDAGQVVLLVEAWAVDED